MKESVRVRGLVCAVLVAGGSTACVAPGSGAGTDDIAVYQAALSETVKTPHPNSFLVHQGGGLEGMPGVGQNGIVSSPDSGSYATEVDTYYGKIGAPSTLAAWKTAFRFPTRLMGETLQEFRNRTGIAVYYNENELGLGREMGCSTFVDGYDSTNRPIMGQACFVTNYGTLFNEKKDALADAMEGLKVKNTVCISNQPHLDVQKRIQFYVYGETGQRQRWAQLDLMGKRAVPEVCTTCHGGKYEAASHLVKDGRFLPTNVNQIGYAEDVFTGVDVGLTKAGQVERFAGINQMAYETPQNDTQMNFVTALYGQRPGLVNQPASASAVPPGWASQPTLWDRVVNPYCGTCHMAIGSLSSDPMYQLISSWSGFSSSAPNSTAGIASTGNRDYVRAQVCMSTYPPNNKTFAEIDRYLTDSLKSNAGVNRCGPGCHFGTTTAGSKGGEYDWSNPLKVLKYAGRISNAMSNAHTTMPPAGLPQHSAGQKTIIRQYLATMAGMPHSQPTMKKFWDVVDPVLGKTAKKALFDAMGVPDCDQVAPGGCTADAQCGAASSGKACVNGLCVDKCSVSGCPSHSRCNVADFCEPCGRHVQNSCGNGVCEAPFAVPDNVTIPHGLTCFECMADSDCASRPGTTRCAATAGTGNPHRCVQCNDYTASLGAGQCGPGRRCDKPSSTCVNGSACGTSNGCPGHDWCGPRGICNSPPTIFPGQDIEDKFDFNGQVKWYSFNRNDSTIGGKAAYVSLDVASAVVTSPAVSLAMFGSNNNEITNTDNFRSISGNDTFGPAPGATSGKYNIQRVAVDGSFSPPEFMRVTNFFGGETNGGRFILNTQPFGYGVLRMRYQQMLIHKNEEQWFYIKADWLGRISIKLKTTSSAGGKPRFEILDEGPWSAVATSSGSAEPLVLMSIPNVGVRNIFYGPADGRNYVVHVLADWTAQAEAATYILTAGNPHICDDQYGTCQGFVDVDNTWNKDSPP